MESDYFQAVIQNLTEEDLRILGKLYDQGANMGLKSMTVEEIQSKTNFTKFKAEKLINQLKSLLFIRVVGNNHQKFYCITELGITALQTSLEGEI